MANQKFMVKVLAVCVGMAVVVSAKSAVIFQDDFNRADGSVGNGWLNDTDSSFPDLVIRDNVLTPSLGETVTGILNRHWFSRHLPAVFQIGFHTL